MVKEVAEITVHDLSVGRAARAARQAASGRPCRIAGCGSSVEIRIVPSTLRPNVKGVPGKLSTGLGGAVASRVRAAVNTSGLLETNRGPIQPPHHAGPSGPMKTGRTSSGQ